MSRFLERQLKSAEEKPLGRVSYWGNRVADAAVRPPNVVKHAIPAARGRGVAKPGEEAAGERPEMPDYPAALVTIR